MSPTSTYRLQVTASFTLDDAARITQYLAQLGVGAVYVSPILQSSDGSDHGYDVVDPTRIDLARGGQDGWQHLVASARAEGLELVVDIVPNHLGVAEASENPFWWDVLKLGRESAYASFFDIEWTHPRILLPVLGDDVDLNTELTVVDGELRYYEHRFPVAPGTGPTGDESPAAVHDRQHYELVNYRRADTDQNYRRFFAVTTLAGLRVEDPDVFSQTHAEILRWVREDGVTGLRADHPDGLADPGGYCVRLREAAGADVWLTIEKILEPGEILPWEWPVDGTTGYDALAEVQAVLLDPGAESRFTQLYQSITGDMRDYHEQVADGKRFVATTILQAEVSRLARLVPSVEHADDALRELLVAFPVYRSYQPLGDEYLVAAAAAVHERRPDLDETVAALLLRLRDPADELCRRFQQTSGAVMAKGVEDTAYYRYSRFIALNEVGADPELFGTSLADFHAAQEGRQGRAAHSMTTLSTHDTKRGEDVRARQLVLAEFPDEWSQLVTFLNDAAPMPNRAFGYLMYQTLVGVGYIDRDRMQAYAEKAMREASDGTQWIDSNEEFEAAVHAALDRCYDEPDIRAQVTAFIDTITPYGRSNSLSQKLIQLTQPGVPDVYRGTEIWEDSLVDPDNRRPVDFAALGSMLESFDGDATPPPVDESGAAKLWLVSRVLRERKAHPDVFAAYLPLYADGVAADHVVAFDRGGAITVATRLPATLERTGGWRNTTLDLDGAWTDVLTGRHYSGVVALSDLLDTYPATLLVLA
jgi:(1->4)-alpha-D-glucan 1-alpha-D-glucosylmutase